MKRRWNAHCRMFSLQTVLPLVFLLLLSLPSLFAATVDPAVTRAFALGQEEVAVIVKLNPAEGENAITAVQEEVLENIQIPNTEDPDFSLTHQYTSIPALGGKITQEGLKKLQSDPLVQEVSFDKVLSIVLDESAPQVGAHKVWNISVGGVPVTGSGETVCVIDTGIDTDHAAFQDKIKAQYCYCSLTNADGLPCCPNNQSEDSSAEDDHGHGTHVAGTAIGNYSPYTGVAKDAGVVAIKVCTAGGSCASSDIISAIDWCSYNATLYNISAISISIGGGLYADYCNSDALAPVINIAVGKNISVVVASGNSGSSTSISRPACVQNATPVGAVNGNDAIFYNRGNILEILAPGISITAPYSTGSTATLSGTSMATPHVSGAIALLRQYWRLAYGKIPTPEFLEKKIALTGKPVYDSSSQRTYGRLDVLAALQPYLNFTSTSVSDGEMTRTTTALINVTSDVALSTAYVQWNFSNGTSKNIFLTAVPDASDDGVSYVLQHSSLAEGTHTYVVFGNDTVNTFGTTAQRMVIVDSTVPQVKIISPSAGVTVTNETLLFNATATDTRLQAVRFIFSNASGTDFVLSPTLTENGSNSWTVITEVDVFVTGNHSMTVQANDTAGNTNATETVYFAVASLSVNLPSVIFVNPFVVHVEERDFPVSSVVFAYDNATGIDFNRTAMNTSGNWNVFEDLGLFTEGNHEVRVSATDSNGNTNNSETLLFVIDRTPPQVNILSPAEGTSFAAATGNYSFNVSVNDVLLSNSLSVHFTLVPVSGASFNITPFNDSGIWKASYNVSSLPDGTQKLVVLASDLSGNMNGSASVSFTVDGTTSPTVTLSAPANNLFTSSTSLSPLCSVTDPIALSSLTLYGNWTGGGWHANQTTTVSGTSNQSTFPVTLFDGSYRWNCLTIDSAGNAAFAPANFTFTVDTVIPAISNVEVMSITSSGVTVRWATDEQANATVEFGVTESLGSTSADAFFGTSQQIPLTGLTPATAYFYKAISCDRAGNCKTGDVLTFTTATAGSSGDAGGGAGGGGGGGGGGGSSGGGSSSESSTPTIAAAVAANAEGTSATTSSEENTVAEGESSLEEVSEPLAQQTGSGSVAQEANLVKGESSSLLFNDGSLAVRSIELTSKSDQKALVSATALSEKPADVAEALQAYQYLEITVGISSEDLKNAKVTFVVPKSWLQERGYAEKQVRLQTYEGEEWVSLKTKVLSSDEKEVVYQATVKHFSYFAITAAPESSGLVGGAVAGLLKAVPIKLNAKILILIGMGLVVGILAIAYFAVRERED